MKTNIAFAILLALGAVTTTAVYAQTDTSSSTSTDQSSQGGAMDQSAQSGQSSAPVEGTASSVDQQAKSLTVQDSASGSEKTFTVTKEDEIKDVKQGDQVTVTPSQSNPMEAESVQKK